MENQTLIKGTKVIIKSNTLNPETIGNVGIITKVINHTDGQFYKVRVGGKIIPNRATKNDLATIN